MRSLKNAVHLVLFSLLLASCAQQKTMLSDNWIDSDLDGIHDAKDACPLEYGSPFNLGCPDNSQLSSSFNKQLSTDSDLDGIPDEKDECPYVYGSPFNMGCPVK